MKPATQSERAEEKALIIKMQGGDPKAFEKLMQGFYTDYVRQLCYNFIRYPNIREDVVNEILIIVWKRCKTFNFKSSFKTWLHSITFNHSCNAVKKEAKHWNGRNCIAQDEKTHPMHITACPRNNPRQNLEYLEMCRVVKHSISTLNAHQRRVLASTEGGVQSEEIARRYNSSPGTVRSRLYYARGRVRSDLEVLGLIH